MQIFGIKTLLFVFLLTLSSCNSIPASVEVVLESAGSNRTELEKVIAHYQKTNEVQKVQAAYFLIENMKEKYSLDGESVRNFDVVFDILDSLQKNNVERPLILSIFKTKWDSVVSIYGRPHIFKATVVEDIKVIKAAFLIENIDLAFEQWKNNRFSEALSFEEFCTYVLPYRIRAERIENWRKYLSEKYKVFRDTVKAKNRSEFTEKLYSKVGEFLYPSIALKDYPYNISVSQMEKAQQGNCPQVVEYTTAIMRANGMPVGIDHANWGDVIGHHFWNTLLLENGKYVKFEAGHVNLAFGQLEDYRPYRLAKVYRQSFAKLDIRFSDEIPKQLVLPFDIDVTPEYTKTFNISVPLTKHIEYKQKPVIILTFGRDWDIPHALGDINNNAAEFKNMGSDILYMVMYYDKGTYIPASDPFVLDKSGKLNYLRFKSSGRQNLQLFRKYPYFANNVNNAKQTIGARIQGANRSDFKDSVNLFTITTMPVKIEETMINSTKKFRYVRYISQPDRLANIAELEFFGSNGLKLQGEVIGFPEVSSLYEESNNKKNAFDNKLGTFFSVRNVPLSWVGLHLPKPENITKIRYCPRSDTNFIVVGDTYELRYWDGDNWKSLGQQTAKNQYLIFRNAPVNTVFILKNLSGGTEERIFTYEKGKQVWW